MSELPPIPVKIRSFEPRDAQVVRHLYNEGLIGGKIADNDTGIDMDDVQAAYMRTRGSHFWVAENPAGEVVGMIGVQWSEDGEGEIRRLRVRPDSRRRGIGAMLLERALKFCEEQHYLKVKLDTFIEREAALKLFKKFKFVHSRTREVGDKSLLYFYLDLYSGDRAHPPPKKL